MQNKCGKESILSQLVRRSIIFFRHNYFQCLLYYYRLAIPLFDEGNLCPSCNNPIMNKLGNHMVHCSSEVGVKFWHNLVPNMLVDIYHKAGISVCKEAPMGFYSKAGNVLRPVDLVLFNWLHEKMHMWMSLQVHPLLAQESPHGYLVLL